MSYDRRRVVSAAFFAVIFFTLLSPMAWALPTMSATTDAGAFPNGGTCSVNSSNLTPSFLPQTQTEFCVAALGVSDAQAFASFGSLGAFAITTMQPCFSTSDCAGSISATAKYFDTSGVFSGPAGIQGTVTTTFNQFVFSGSATADPNGGADAIGSAFVNGTLAVLCTNTVPGGSSGCGAAPITLPIGVTVSLELDLFVDAGANAAFNSQPVSASASYSHTFGFTPGAQVFNLPDGYTFNDLDAFIFNIG
jgi:hypothetical protein